MNREAIRDALRVRNHGRQLARTNLLWLANHVLGYKDVSREVHGPILDALQKFHGGEDVEVADMKYEYRPFLPHWKLRGCRQNLFLYPRGHLKTSIISIAHTIQWIINHPNIRVLISCATGDQIDNVMGGLLKQFRYNPYLRALFPEYCPAPEKAADWGNKERFTVPCRTDYTLKEPTVWSSTVGKVVAGGRADVVKHSDLVDEQNVKTPGGIKEVISHFGHMEPLLERYNAAEGFAASVGWNDVEGTRYDFGDLYGTIIKSVEEQQRIGKTPDWNVVLRSAIQLNGQPLWPQRFSLDELERIRRQPTVGEWIFSAQYLNKCIPPTDGLCDPRDVIFVPGDVIRQSLHRLRLHVTIDLHGMEQSRSNDYTVITLGGFDRDGKLYIIETKLGRYTPEEVITHIFDLHQRYPQIIDFKIEKDAHARVLLPFLQREMSKRQRFPTVWPIRRDTHVSKKHRIRGLRPWFKTGIILFSQDLPGQVKAELLDEVAQFPSESAGVHDDILDTLADQMQNQEGGLNLDVISDPPDVKFGAPRPRDRFLGFAENGIAQWLYGSDGEPQTSQVSKTGIL